MFISVGVLCEFAIVSGVYHFLSTQEEDYVHSSSWVPDVHIQQRIHKKKLSLCLPLYYSVKAPVKLGKKNKECNCVMVFITRPTSTLKFLFFWFQWMSLSNLFLFKIGRFLVIMYLGCRCITFDFMTEITLSHLFTHPHE